MDGKEKKITGKKLYSLCCSVQFLSFLERIRLKELCFLSYNRFMTNLIHKYFICKTRKEWAANDAKRDAGLKISDKVKICDNISYGPYGKDNLLCVYRPENYPEEKLPVIINIHGGGFFYGDKELYGLYSADMAERGFAVVVFNYRLCPEKLYPSPLEDINNVTKWVLSHCDEFDFDPDRIFIVGDSAGGQLALNYTTMLSNPDYAGLFDFDLPHFIPKKVCLNSALTNLVKDGQVSERSKQILTVYLGSGRKIRKNLERLDVQKYITSDFPPVFVMTAPNDFLFSEAKPLHELFLSRGVKSEYHVYGEPSDDWANHVFHLNLSLPAGRQCNDDEAEFLRK